MLDQETILYEKDALLRFGKVLGKEAQGFGNIGFIRLVIPANERIGFL